MASNTHSPLSVRDQWAQHHVTQALRKMYNASLRSPEQKPLGDNEGLPPPPLLDFPPARPTDTPPKVCIIGAGAAGLFTAMLFDYLNQNVSGFNVQYDIFESADSTRVGGRLYTYRFSKDPHDYYDVGAMRFPDNQIMQSYLGMQTIPNPPPNPPVGSIIPYYMQGVNEPWIFNGQSQTGDYKTFASAAANNDPFLLNFDTTQPIPPTALQAAAASEQGADQVFEYAVQPYVDHLKNDPVTGWQLLMTIDTMSTSEFLAINPPIPNPSAPIMPPFNYNTIEWLETFTGGTNWYDQAHSENVLEYLDFHYNDTTSWYCIEGGAQQLALNMAAQLKSPSTMLYNSRITGIDVSTPSEAKIQLNGQWQGSYAGVFNSTTMGCMQQMDLTAANLNYGQKQAIRSLGYGASAKIGMKFSEPWWRTTFGITQGGLGHSDLPIRTTVYPSYNLQDPVGSSAVLLCSYEWQQDAQRISTLISSSSDHDVALLEEAPLRELVLRDLALLHSKQPGTNMDADTVYNLIKPLCIDHYAHDWYHDNNTYGAFAFFRPQQFGSMWPYIIQPSPSLVMIGEHASNHHAWVVGALESAVNGVYGWLSQNNFPGAQAAAQAMKSWDGPTNQNPFGGLPQFVSEEQKQWQAIFGLANYERFQRELGKAKGGAK